MNADQYSNYIGQACANSGTTLPGGYKMGEDGRYHFQDNTNTDWFSEVFKTGIRQNHNVALSGGSAKSTYNVSLDYFNQKGTLEGAGPNYERYTARVNNTMDTKVFTAMSPTCSAALCSCSLPSRLTTRQHGCSTIR